MMFQLFNHHLPQASLKPFFKPLRLTIEERQQRAALAARIKATDAAA
jgi:hypothetical protein